MKRFVSVLVIVTSLFLSCVSVSAIPMSVDPKVGIPPTFSEEKPSLRFGDPMKFNELISIKSDSIDALLMINGTFVHDIFPTIENGRSLVPVRVISEQMAFNVDWINSENKVVIANEKKTIELFIGNKTAKVDNSDIALEVPAKIINGKTYVPIRFIADAFGMQIGYEKDIIKFPIVWVANEIDVSKIAVTEKDSLNSVQKAIKELAISQNMLDMYNEVIPTFKFENAGEVYGRFWLITAKDDYASNTKYFLVDKETKQMFIGNMFGINDGFSLFNYFVAG